MSPFWALLGAAAMFTLAPSSRADAPAASLAGTIHDNDRIVFVGDSITGQGGNNAQGWTHLMTDALAVSHPAGPPTLIPLGGSGQTIGSWQNVEKRSRDQPVTLDVKGVDVKATLDQHADVVVIMLGMNDVLSPSLNGDQASFDGWAARYRELIASLRARTTPRVLALATVPPCTEDEASPKNQAIAQLTQRIAAIAKEEKALVLPVHQADMDALQRGRALRPDFHVTMDFVHPNAYGHVAIAEGMLQGLGEPAAVKSLADGYGARIWKGVAPVLPVLSYTLEYLPSPSESDTQSCKIRVWYTAGDSPAPAAQIRLAVPAGWTVTPAVWKGAAAAGTTANGEFTVTGPFDRLQNTLTLQAATGAGQQDTPIQLPAPWLIGTGGLRQMTWGAGNSTFDPVKSHLPSDDALLRGESWGKAVELAPGHPLQWVRHNPTVNFLGGASPGSVDMAGVTFFQSFEVGYGARWIYSEKERPVQFKLGSASFGGNDYLAVFLNGQSLYSGSIMADRGKLLDATLHKGWNALMFKSNHLAWQWHFSIDLVPAAADDLADLRVSIVPHAGPAVPAAG